MKVEMRDIGNIKPYEKNPRRNDEALDAVAHRGFPFASARRGPIDRDDALDERGFMWVTE